MHELEHTYKHTRTDTHKHARTHRMRLCACNTHAEQEQTRGSSDPPLYTV